MRGGRGRNRAWLPSLSGWRSSAGGRRKRRRRGETERPQAGQSLRPSAAAAARSHLESFLDVAVVVDDLRGSWLSLLPGGALRGDSRAFIIVIITAPSVMWAVGPPAAPQVPADSPSDRRLQRLLCLQSPPDDRSRTDVGRIQTGNRGGN